MLFLYPALVEYIVFGDRAMRDLDLRQFANIFQTSIPDYQIFFDVFLNADCATQNTLVSLESLLLNRRCLIQSLFEGSSIGELILFSL